MADHADLLVLDHDAPALPARAGRRGVPVVRLDRREPIDAEALGRHLLPGLPEAARARLRDYAGERALRAGAEAPDFCWAGPIRHAPRLGWYAGLYPRLRDRLVPPAAVAANARLGRAVQLEDPRRAAQELAEPGEVGGVLEVALVLPPRER